METPDAFHIAARAERASAVPDSEVLCGAKGASGGNHPVELWGGIECTVNRVGDMFYDQNGRSGHCSRIDDIHRFGELGIKKLRYPVLWETHSEKSDAWKVTHTALNLVRECGMEPIAGLVHHGSGPADTSLLHENFITGLTRHATEVASAFPWVQYYTPVNEPLTTARFSCLYGHWFPHHQDPYSFLKALLIELEATRAAMKAIRQINPAAKLVQTEDMGKTYSTAPIAYQAEFDNHRRWLSFDLLCGRVNEDHPLWGYFLSVGIPPAAVLTFAEDPCPPDIFGINYYVTSERFLDHRLENFPERLHGGNGRDRYADASAVRVSSEGIAGHYGILKETWERYRSPVALTEVHLGCTREEQVRWLMEGWKAANALAAEGVDLRGVTAWSLLGAFDWDSLLVRCDGNYEAGVFDLRSSSAPRPTALAKCIRSLATTGTFTHPVINSPGWWRKDIRFTYRQAEPAQHGAALARFPFVSSQAVAPIVVTGARGTLGSAFVRLCEVRGLNCIPVPRDMMDIGDLDSVRKIIGETKPWAVVNCAGYVRVDEAEKDIVRCFRENVQGPVNLAQVCQDRGIPLVTFSSDLVFDGGITRPYVESNPVNPLNIYGRSKVAAETKVVSLSPLALVVRTSAFFGPWDQYNFLVQTAARLRRGETVQAAADYYVSPTYVPDLVNACLDLLIDGEHGIWHVANSGEISWAELARRSARGIGVSDRLIEPVPLAQMGLSASRPRYSVLGTEKSELLPSLDTALSRFFVDAKLN